MSGWCAAFIAATSRELKASSPFFMSARRCAVRLVLVESIYFILVFVFITASVMAKVVWHSDNSFILMGRPHSPLLGISPLPQHDDSGAWGTTSDGLRVGVLRVEGLIEAGSRGAPARASSRHRGT